MTYPLLHVSDWNFRDKYYRVPVTTLQEMAEKVKKEDVDKVWDWFVSQVDYDGPNSIHRLSRVPANEDAFFFDFMNPIESVEEWDLSEARKQ